MKSTPPLPSITKILEKLYQLRDRYADDPQWLTDWEVANLEVVLTWLTRLLHKYGIED